MTIDPEAVIEERSKELLWVLIELATTGLTCCVCV